MMNLYILQYSSWVVRKNLRLYIGPYNRFNPSNTLNHNKKNDLAKEILLKTNQKIIFEQRTRFYGAIEQNIL